MIPLTFFFTAFLGFGIYHFFTPDPFWFRTGLIATFGGIATSLMAAGPFINAWLFDNGHYSPVRKVGWLRVILGVGAVGLFTANLFVQMGSWDRVPPSSYTALTLSAVGFLMAALCGILSLTLIGQSHVGLKIEPIAK